MAICLSPGKNRFLGYRGVTQMHLLPIMKRPNPLTVRLSENEKRRLSNAAAELGTSRNNLVRTAAMSFIRELKSEQLVGAAQ